MEVLAGSALRGPYVWGSPLALSASPPERLEATFSVEYSYAVHFTRDALDPGNEVLAGSVEAPGAARVLPVLDGDLLTHHPALLEQLQAYAERHAARLTLAGPAVVLPGGERLKEQPEHVATILTAIHRHGVDRQSYVLAIGGGALLDVAGYATAVAHRGLRHIRMPTTVLSQSDSGVGVKNGFNAFATKNFVGTFAPPVAVINDESFLATLSDRDWRGGRARRSRSRCSATPTSSASSSSSRPR